MSKGAFAGTQANLEAGRRLRGRRKALGMSQDDMTQRIAADLGLFYDQSTISDWENGVSESPYAVAVWLENQTMAIDKGLKKCYTPYPQAA